MRLAKELHAIRQSAKLSQAQLAERLGLHRTMIAHVEGGRKQTTGDIIEDWARYCGCAIAVLAQEEFALIKAVREIRDDAPERLKLMLRIALLLPDLHDAQFGDLSALVRHWETRDKV